MPTPSWPLWPPPSSVTSLPEAGSSQQGSMSSAKSTKPHCSRSPSSRLGGIISWRHWNGDYDTRIYHQQASNFKQYQLPSLIVNIVNSKECQDRYLYSVQIVKPLCIYDYYYLVGWKNKCSVILYYLQMWKIIGCSLIKINIDNKQQINNTEDYNFAEHYVDIYTIYSDTEVRTGLDWKSII